MKTKTPGRRSNAKRPSKGAAKKQIISWVVMESDSDTKPFAAFADRDKGQCQKYIDDNAIPGVSLVLKAVRQ